MARVDNPMGPLVCARKSVIIIITDCKILLGSNEASETASTKIVYRPPLHRILVARVGGKHRY